MAKRIPWLALLVIVPLLAYAPALRCGFVWDDHTVIEQGLLIDSLANVPRLFLHDAMYNSDGGKFAQRSRIDTYRPLTLTTFFVERAVWGKRPAGFHLDSVILHAGNCLLLFAIGLLLGLSQPAALLGALLFASHPAISEAIYWINGRSDPLCTFFFLGALLLWLGGLREPSRQRAHFLPISLLMAAATMCKETAFLLPLPLLLLFPERARGLRSLLWSFGPWALGGLAGLVCRLLALSRVAVSVNAVQSRYALVRLPALWMDGLRSLLTPAARLEPSLLEHYQHLSGPYVLFGSVCLLLVLCLAAWRYRRGRRLPLAGLVSLLVTLAPVSMLTFVHGWSGWGRYLYPAAPLLCLGVAREIGDGLPSAARPWLRQRWLGAAVGLVIALCILRTWQAGQAWRDDRSFAAAQIAARPEVSTGYAGLAQVELREGHPERALPLLQRAVRLAPSDPAHWVRLATAWIRLNQPEQALAAARQALALSPGNPAALDVLALSSAAQVHDGPLHEQVHAGGGQQGQGRDQDKVGEERP